MTDINSSKKDSTVMNYFPLQHSSVGIPFRFRSNPSLNILKVCRI